MKFDIKKLISKFDYGKKGYLTYTEYESMTLMMGIQPSKMGKNKIYNLKIKEGKENLEEIYKFITKDGVMEIKHFKRVCELIGLKYKEEEINQLINYFKEEPKDKFKMMFNTKIE